LRLGGGVVVARPLGVSGASLSFSPPPNNKSDDKIEVEDDETFSPIVLVRTMRRFLLVLVVCVEARIERAPEKSAPWIRRAPGTTSTPIVEESIPWTKYVLTLLNIT